MKWRNACYFCAQNRWKCEEDIFLKNKYIYLYLKSSKSFSIEKILRETFAQLWEKRKRWSMNKLQRSLPPNLKHGTMINGKKLNL